MQIAFNFYQPNTQQLHYSSIPFIVKIDPYSFSNIVVLLAPQNCMDNFKITTRPHLQCSDINACLGFPCLRRATCTDLKARPNSTAGRTCHCRTNFHSPTPPCYLLYSPPEVNTYYVFVWFQKLLDCHSLTDWIEADGVIPDGSVSNFLSRLKTLAKFDTSHVFEVNFTSIGSSICNISFVALITDSFDPGLIPFSLAALLAADNATVLGAADWNYAITGYGPYNPPDNTFNWDGFVIWIIVANLGFLLSCVFPCLVIYWRMKHVQQPHPAGQTRPLLPQGQPVRSSGPPRSPRSPSQLPSPQPPPPSSPTSTPFRPTTRTS